MAGDYEFVRFLTEHGYHPRSNAHGDRLCELLILDLLETCPHFRQLAAERRIVYTLNFVVGKGTASKWNIDLVVGPPDNSAEETAINSGALILKGNPTAIWLAIDAKSIMTEHGKARYNRQRDIDSLHINLHRKDPRTIVGGLMVINMSERFKSPLRQEVTIHRNIQNIIRGTIELFSIIPRSHGEGTQGLDAMGIIIVDHTNEQEKPARLVERPPAPVLGSEMHYQTFLGDICAAFSERYPL